MTFKTTKLRDAITYALVAGVAGFAGINTASAQTTGTPVEPSNAPTELDRVEVTGSRIRQVDLETTAPIVLISRENIEKQGFNSVADILQNLSSVGSPAISRTSPLSSGENVGGQYIDLRNIGPNRTLVLVNGKRLGITNDGLQDIASIPAAAVERIEVLKDGASTIYGSDAIAGVINIITRKNFNGAEATAYVGQYGEGDGQREQYSFLVGSTSDRTAVTFGFEYTKEDQVLARDRWFSRNRFPTGEKSDPRPGGLSSISKEGVLFDAAGNRFTLIRDGQPRDATDFANFRPYSAALDSTNPSLASSLQTGVVRKSVFANGSFDITDNVRFETDLLYTDRESTAQNAGYPYRSNAFGTPMSADSLYNPLPGQEVTFWRRGWEQPRGVENNLQTFRFAGTLSGAFQIGERYWDWDTGYLYNQNKGTQISTGNFNTNSVAAAVGPSFRNAQGVVQCGTVANPTPLGFGPGACTPWNPFVPAGFANEGGLNDPAVRAFLFLPGQALSETTTKDYFANLTGTIATLPAGDLGVAVGVEHREEKGFFSPDALAQTGISTDLAAGPTGGGYSLDEAYVELQVPILADLPFAKELSVNLASRYSNYDTFGDTINSKFGFKWKPIDGLLVRGTYAEGFRAPTVGDLFGGISQTFAFYTDPCDTLFGSVGGSAQCLADVPAGYRQPASDPDGKADGPGTQTPTPFLSGSNPALTPETARSKTLGVAWSPTFVDGLFMSLDWWNIRIENTIVGDSPTAILDDCYVKGITSRCSAALFQRDPGTGEITSLSFGGRNAGYQETEGFDFDVNYKLATAYGDFTAAWLSSYVTKNELKTANDDNPPSQQNGFGGNFRLRSNASLSWDKGDFGVTYAARYFSGTKDSCYFDERCSLPEYAAPDTQGNIVPQNELGADVFQDLQLRYNTPWNATVAVGANNVFDHSAAPAYDQPNSGYSYYGGFDIGRFFYLKYQQRF